MVAEANDDRGVLREDHFFSPRNELRIYGPARTVEAKAGAHVSRSEPETGTQQTKSYSPEAACDVLWSSMAPLASCP